MVATGKDIFDKALASGHKVGKLIKETPYVPPQTPVIVSSTPQTGQTVLPPIGGQRSGQTSS